MRTGKLSKDNVQVEIVVCDVRQFVKACVALYLKLADQNEDISNKNAPTPHLSDYDKLDESGYKPGGKLRGIAAPTIVVSCAAQTCGCGFGC